MIRNMQKKRCLSKNFCIFAIVKNGLEMRTKAIYAVLRTCRFMSKALRKQQLEQAALTLETGILPPPIHIY